VANIRSGPGTDNAVVGQVIENTEVTILAGGQDWYQIQYQNISGWISSSLVDLKTIPLEVTTEIANLRKGPGTSYQQAGQLQKGIRLTGLEQQGDWYQIQAASGEFLYISAALVTPVGNTSSQVPPAADTPGAAAVNISEALPPQVYLDQKLMRFDVDPLIKEGRTLVPLRAIFEAVGAEVRWDEAAQMVTAGKDSVFVQLQLGNSIALVNGMVIPLDVPAQIISNRTLAPLRFAGETFGGQVDWNADTRTVHIKTRTEEAPPETPPDSGTPPGQEKPAGNQIVNPNLQEVKISYSQENEGIKIVVEVTGDKRIRVNENGGYISYTVDQSYVASPLYAEEKIGSQILYIDGKNNQEQAEVNITIPSGISYERSSENNGTRETITVPNVITGVERETFGSSGERVIVRTLLPVTYTENLQRNTMKIFLHGVQKGMTQSRYTYSSPLLSQVQFTETGGRMVNMEIDTNEAAKYTVGQSDDRKELHVLFIPSKNAVPKNGVVVLDAGHGGSEIGARGTVLYEKDVNLDITLRVGKILTGQGIKVEYTRTTDQTVPLNDIATYANMMNAVVFVSIHNNSHGNLSANGTEVYYYAPIDEPDLYMQKDERERLASLLMDQLRKLNRADRGVKNNIKLLVLRKTTMPSALCEVAFISNQEEEQLLMQDSFKQQAAQLIANGILQYMNENPDYQVNPSYPNVTDAIDLTQVRP
jgi:N-acetylmuramoyl-L-alanine amidase